MVKVSRAPRSWWPPKVIRGCVGKVKHESQGKADAMIRWMHKRDGEIFEATETLNSYFCVRCRSWHVGNGRDRG